MPTGFLIKCLDTELNGNIFTFNDDFYVQWIGLQKLSTRAPQFYDFLHFKGCSYLNRKISFNLSVEVAIFLVFHNPFMMLFHILMSISDHELMLDNFLLRSSVYSIYCSVINSSFECKMCDTISKMKPFGCTKCKAKFLQKFFWNKHISSIK